MIDDGYHRTLVSLSVVSRDFSDILRPFLKRTRKRIVVDLYDLDELEEERYGDIQ